MDYSCTDTVFDYNRQKKKERIAPRLADASSVILLFAFRMTISDSHEHNSNPYNTGTSTHGKWMTDEASSSRYSLSVSEYRRTFSVCYP